MLRCVFAPWLLVACSGPAPDTGTPDTAGAPPPLDTLDVVVGPTNLDFGEVFVGQRATGTFAVLNQGSDPLVVSVVVDSPQPAAWTLSSAQAMPQPGDYASFDVTVSVSELVSYAGAVVVTDAWQRELGRVGLTVRTRVDADGDGFGAVRYAGDDCNDDDPAVHPGAAETFYDGVDQDCDGSSDYDADGDGVDSAAYGGEDCDDTDAAVFPGAVDSPYDGIDQDCAADSDSDADGDGFDAWEAGGMDCDDERASVSPASGGCWSGEVDAAVLGTAVTGPTGAGFGAAVSAPGALLGDGAAILVAAPGAGLERGRVWRIAGPVTAAGTVEDRGSLWAEGSAGDRLGTAIALGRPDGGDAAVLLGAPGHRAGEGGVLWTSAEGEPVRWLQGEAGTGTALAVGDLNGDGSDEIAASGRGSVLLFDASGDPGPLPGEGVQTTLAAGDLDGDGYGDVVLGRPEHSDGETELGSVWVGFGGSAGLSLDASTTVVTMESGGGVSAGLGAAVLLSDRNGDGQLDLVAADSEGEVLAFVGPLTPGSRLDTTQAEERWSGAPAGAAPLLMGGDADEDGLQDLLVGLPDAEATAVWLAGGGHWSEVGSATVPVLGAPVGALSSLSDLDGDSHRDLVVGDPTGDRVFVLQGPALRPHATGDAAPPSLPTREMP